MYSMSSLSIRSASGPGAAVRARRADTPGTELRLLLLTSDTDQCVGIDLVSGALVRALSPRPIDPDLRPYDVVAATLDDTVDLLPDPSEPEAVPLVAPPGRVGRITGRQAERYLRPLVHPPGQPLLGAHGPALPFWQRTADQPSVAIVEPEGPAVVRRHDGWLSCSFGWRAMAVEMPCIDHRAAKALSASGRLRVATAKGDRLLVSWTPPIDGHCHKVVEALLLRP